MSCRDRQARPLRVAVAVAVFVALIGGIFVSFGRAMQPRDLTPRLVRQIIEQSQYAIRSGNKGRWVFSAAPGTWRRVRTPTGEQVEWLLSFPKDDVARVKISTATETIIRDIQRQPKGPLPTVAAGDFRVLRDDVHLTLGGRRYECGIAQHDATESLFCPELPGGIAKNDNMEVLDIGYTPRVETVVYDLKK